MHHISNSCAGKIPTQVSKICTASTPTAHLISNSTGETLITVARAAAAQYSRIMPVEHVHPLVRTH
jgi:hypothetical protein